MSQAKKKETVPTVVVGSMQDQLEEMFVREPEAEGRKAACSLCNDEPGHQMPVQYMRDGTTVTGMAEIDRMVMESNCASIDQVLRTEVVRCTECWPKFVRKVEMKHAICRSGEEVDYGYIKKLVKANKAKAKLKTDPLKVALRKLDKPCFMYGETGHFKTVILEYWYNKSLHKLHGVTESLFYTTENKMILGFMKEGEHGEGNSLIKEWEDRFVTKIFIDELFVPGNYDAREGHYAQKIRRGFINVFDWMYRNQAIVLVFGTSNYLPEEVLKAEEQQPVIRRFDDAFGGLENRVHM